MASFIVATTAERRCSSLEEHKFEADDKEDALRMAFRDRTI